MARYTLKSGYAFRLRGCESEIECITPDTFRSVRHIGFCRIDDAPCIVFEVVTAEGGRRKYAQTEVAARD